MADETIPTGMFETRCLTPLESTKRGKPIAKTVPVGGNETPSLIGSVLWETDLVSPIDEDWDAG
ncbi:MAG TPA: hypothetical protein VML01_08530 [Bryobacterales bacterium]|nr:hypothetical protein [Bryobacterales bacterium]